LIRCVREKAIPAGSVITATMTGHGLKDPDTAMEQSEFKPTVVPATLEAVSQVIGIR
jgi:threonine synthase